MSDKTSSPVLATWTSKPSRCKRFLISEERNSSSSVKRIFLPAIDAFSIVSIVEKQKRRYRNRLFCIKNFVVAPWVVTYGSTTNTMLKIDTPFLRREKKSLIDPRTASATRALLRLRPCHRSYLDTSEDVFWV